MSFSPGSMGATGSLALDLQKAPTSNLHKAKGLRIRPFGRLWWTKDQGSSHLLSREQFMTNLTLEHRDGDNKLIEERDCGSGLVTNAGVNLMSNDWNWTNCTLKQANYHAIGTGATAAALTDVWLQTPQGSTSLAGTTNGYMTGTQHVIANNTSSTWQPIYQTSAVFTCNGGAGLPITEWVLCVANSANITHTSNSTTISSLTDTSNSPFGAANASAQLSLITGSATPINTPTTTPMMQVYQSSTTVLTALASAWSSGSIGLALDRQSDRGYTDRCLCLYALPHRLGSQGLRYRHHEQR